MIVTRSKMYRLNRIGKAQNIMVTCLQASTAVVKNANKNTIISICNISTSKYLVKVGIY